MENNPPENVGPGHEPTLRVATLNLWGLRGVWDKRRSVLIKGFEALRPDLIAFQEAIKDDQCDMLRDLLGPEYHVVYQTGQEDNGQRAAVASRWPLEEVREVEQQV